MEFTEAFNVGVEMADRFIAELEEAFQGMDEDTLFALAGGCWQLRWTVSLSSTERIRMRSGK